MAIPEDIRAYNAAQSAGDRRICETLCRTIDRHLPGAESKIWHRHPVWFLDGNPIVGYSKLKDSIRLLFWSGRSFDEPGLHEEGTFKAAEARYTAADQIVPADLERWLAKSIDIQWDYKNIMKRKGRLVRLPGGAGGAGGAGGPTPGASKAAPAPNTLKMVPSKTMSSKTAKKTIRKTVRKTPTKTAAIRGAPPRLLSGGNPQIPKGEGDAPVRAYIAAMPGWKREVGRRLDALIERAVAEGGGGLRKAVKWNSPFYGAGEDGWFLSFHCFATYIKVGFFRGSSLRPPPPGESKQKEVRYLDIHEGDWGTRADEGRLDEARLADWVKQASRLPGVRM